ncbi:MAG: NAD(P)H-binding protein [Granulosicoccus sp.]
MNQKTRRVLVLGATGTIGQSVCEALLSAGYQVTCFVRTTPSSLPACLSQANIRTGDVTSQGSLREEGFGNDTFDAVVSCLGSRTGTPTDAWAVDYGANADAIDVAAEKGVKHFVLLSAICVQRPRLAFQFAKLAAEKALAESGMTYSIVRPTAFFKSLSGQIERLKRGKPFLMFGNGELTACKPISDPDLASYMVSCLADADKHNQILPIGGPGLALTPKAQSKMLFRLLDKPEKHKRVPVWMLDIIIFTLATAGAVLPRLRDKAELARIGRYYATESMLAWDEATGDYDADLTPSTGTQTLEYFYTMVISEDIKVDLGDHAVF